MEEHKLVFITIEDEEFPNWIIYTGKLITKQFFTEKVIRNTPASNLKHITVRMMDTPFSTKSMMFSDGSVYDTGLGWRHERIEGYPLDTDYIEKLLNK